MTLVSKGAIIFHVHYYGRKGRAKWPKCFKRQNLCFFSAEVVEVNHQHVVFNLKEWLKLKPFLDGDKAFTFWIEKTW